MERCENWEQNCHTLCNALSKRCAKRKGVICENFMGWKHYPDSPWGDIDICAHGVTREHGSTENPCRFCEDDK